MNKLAMNCRQYDTLDNIMHMCVSKIQSMIVLFT